MTSAQKRWMINGAIFFSLFLLPWYMAACACIIALWFFEYLEIIVAGMILDALYGSFLFSVSAYGLFALSIYAKPRLSFYTH